MAVNKKHEVLVTEAKEAITAVYSDTTVDRSQTTESLMDLSAEIEILLDTLN